MRGLDYEKEIIRRGLRRGALHTIGSRGVCRRQRVLRLKGSAGNALGELASKSDVYTIEVGGKPLVIDAAGNLKGTAGLKIEAKDLEIFFITDVQYVSLPDRTILSVDFGNGDYVTGAFYVLGNALDKNP